MPVRMTKPQRERFLRGRHVAVLVTIAPDGTPVPTPIWYLYRDGMFYFRTASDAIKTRHVSRDPRVSICVQDERVPYKAVIAYGDAEISEQQTWLAREMPRHYLGAIGGMGYQAGARSRIEAGAEEITLTVRPERTTTFDFTPETPIFGRIWLTVKRVLPPWL